MKIQTTIMLDGNEKHILKFFQEALNLIGWQDDDTVALRNTTAKNLDHLTAEGQKVWHDMKAIRKIRPCLQAQPPCDGYTILHDEHLPTRIGRVGGVFADQQTDKGFCDGVRSSARLAIRQLDNFLDGLKEAMSDYHAREDRLLVAN
jgi:hypothetical protein